MEPTFNYPLPTDRHVWIKCDKDAGQEFWCAHNGWVDRADYNEDVKADHPCGQTWRKRVSPPIGYEFAPKSDRLTVGHLFLDGIAWSPIKHDHNLTIGEYLTASGKITICVRPVAKPEELDPEVREALEKAFWEETKPTNYYARTIKGVQIDVYDILAAYNVDNHAVAHAVKKLLRLGNGQKERLTDITEAKRSIERALELEGKQ